MQNQPLVSIVIPVYNGANYMREAIDSALAQSYENIEIIVVNDGSDDDGQTDSNARSYGDKIRYFSKENGGVSSALNLGIREMKGEYFSWLSHDDLYLPDKVRLEMEALLNAGDKRYIAYCGCSFIDGESQPLRMGVDLKDTEKCGEIEFDDVLYDLVRKNSLGGCCVLIPRRTFDEVGLFDEELRYCQDILMWYRIFLAGYGMVRIPDKLVLSRIHANQVTQTRSDLFYHDSRKLCEYLLPELEKINSPDRDFTFRYSLSNARFNNPQVINKCIAQLKGRAGFTVHKRFVIRLVQCYGCLRPTIRKIYYKLRYGIAVK